jgi:hypothetical protein
MAQKYVYDGAVDQETYNRTRSLSVLFNAFIFMQVGCSVGVR